MTKNISTDLEESWDAEAEKAWQQCEARKTRLEDEKKALQYEAERRGRQEGLQEGKVQATVSHALALLNILDDTTIATTLSLPLEIVQQLRAGGNVVSIQEKLFIESMVTNASDDAEGAVDWDELFERVCLRLEMMRKMNEAAWMRYESRQMWLRDSATRQYEAEMEGFLEGFRKSRKAQAEVKVTIESAIAVLDVLDDAAIADSLSLPLEIVQRLRAGDDTEKITGELYEEKMKRLR